MMQQSVMDIIMMKNNRKTWEQTVRYTLHINTSYTYIYHSHSSLYVYYAVCVATFSSTNEYDPNDDRALPVSKASYTYNDADALPITGDDSTMSSVLPAAEPISSAHKSEADPLIEIYGLDRIQQLYSKHWQLRVEALASLSTLLSVSDAESSLVNTPSTVLLASLSKILIRALNDKVTLVFISASRLLEGVMKEIISKMSKDECRPLIDAVARSMTDKVKAYTTHLCIYSVSVI